MMGQTNSTAYTFTTFVGNTGYGSVDGTGSTARFYSPHSTAVDNAGNVYVADTDNNTIRKVTPAGVVATLAGMPGSSGSSDGTGVAARFNAPGGVAVDHAGNVYVADIVNNTVRKVTSTGVVTTLAGSAGFNSQDSADGIGSAARFNRPIGVAVDGATNIYVADSWNVSIRKVAPSGTSWVVTTLAGKAGSRGSTDGMGNIARFNDPEGVAVDGSGNIYVADTFYCGTGCYGNNTIRKISLSGTNWMVTTLAGLAGSIGTNDGTGSTARFNYPSSVAVDTAGNVYVADTFNDTIRKVTPAGVVTTLAGMPGSSGSADGTGSAARFDYPYGLAVDSAGTVYVADTLNHLIRKVTPAGAVTTFTGPMGSYGSADGTGNAARFYLPYGLAVDSAGSIYVADTDNHTIRMVTPAGVATTLAGLAGNPGSVDGIGSAARFNSPTSVAVGSATNIYVTDDDTIRQVTPGGLVTTLAGLAGGAGTNDGSGDTARFYQPSGVAVDNASNIYVADSLNSTIRQVTPTGTNWVVTTLAGLAGSFGTNDGTGSNARFNSPYGVALDRVGNILVTDGTAIRKVTTAGVVTTLARLAESNAFYGLAVDGSGNVFLADAYEYDYVTNNNFTICEVASNGVATSLAGLAKNSGNADGTGTAARFNYPYGVAVDGAGNIYVADTYNSIIRKGVPTSTVAAPILQPPGLNGNQFAFGMTGLAGLALDIEYSGDLSHWHLVGTYELVDGTNYVVAPAPPLTTQFFRARVH